MDWLNNSKDPDCLELKRHNLAFIVQIPAKIHPRNDVHRTVKQPSRRLRNSAAGSAAQDGESVQKIVQTVQKTGQNVLTWDSFVLVIHN